MKELSWALWETLSGGATGDGEATGIYEKSPPPGVTYPVVIYQKVVGTDEYTFGNHRTLRSVVYLVKVIDQGYDSQRAQEIMNDVDTDLHNASLDIDNYVTMSCVRESDMPSYTEVAGGVMFQHEGAYYRIFVSPEE